MSLFRPSSRPPQARVPRATVPKQQRVGKKGKSTPVLIVIAEDYAQIIAQLHRLEGTDGEDLMPLSTGLSAGGSTMYYYASNHIRSIMKILLSMREFSRVVQVTRLVNKNTDIGVAQIAETVSDKALRPPTEQEVRMGGERMRVFCNVFRMVEALLITGHNQKYAAEHHIKWNGSGVLEPTITNCAKQHILDELFPKTVPPSDMQEQWNQYYSDESDRLMYLLKFMTGKSLSAKEMLSLPDSERERLTVAAIYEASEQSKLLQGTYEVEIVSSGTDTSTKRAIIQATKAAKPAIKAKTAKDIEKEVVAEYNLLTGASFNSVDIVKMGKYPQFESGLNWMRSIRQSYPTSHFYHNQQTGRPELVENPIMQAMLGISNYGGHPTPYMNMGYPPHPALMGPRPTHYIAGPQDYYGQQQFQPQMRPQVQAQAQPQMQPQVQQHVAVAVQAPPRVVASAPVSRPAIEEVKTKAPVSASQPRQGTVTGALSRLPQYTVAGTSSSSSAASGAPVVSRQRLNDVMESNLKSALSSVGATQYSQPVALPKLVVEHKDKEAEDVVPIDEDEDEGSEQDVDAPSTEDVEPKNP